MTEPDPDTRPARIADGLEINGGIVLLASGIVLVVLACVFASEATIAPIFAVSGPSMLILGAFYSRIEGDIEATREGVKATVRALRRRAREQNLPDEIADEALDRALWNRSGPGATWKDLGAEMRAEQAISEVQTEHEKMVATIARWLEEDGYKVSRPAHGVDLVGVRADEIVGVEVKVSLALGVAAVRQVASFQLPSDPARTQSRRILAFPSHAGASTAAQAEAVRLKVELMTVDDQGNVKAFTRN